MCYQIHNSTEMASVKFQYNMDGTVEITKFKVYKDSSDESFLKMIKEF